MYPPVVSQMVSPVLHLFTPASLLPLEPLATADLFTVPTILPSLESLESHSMKLFFFSYWLLSLSNMHLKFLEQIGRVEG